MSKNTISLIIFLFLPLIIFFQFLAHFPFLLLSLFLLTFSLFPLILLLLLLHTRHLLFTYSLHNLSPTFFLTSLFPPSFPSFFLSFLSFLCYVLHFVTYLDSAPDGKIVEVESSTQLFSVSKNHVWASDLQKICGHRKESEM